MEDKSLLSKLAIFQGNLFIPTIWREKMVQTFLTGNLFNIIIGELMFWKLGGTVLLTMGPALTNMLLFSSPIS